MIIRIQAAGGSFRGAGQYYLHDKAEDKEAAKAMKPSTSERVWFTATRNCANTDPEKALDEMWHVAESQRMLKQMNGLATSGRACADPVKTLSISWHKDDRPEPQHMLDAADAYLKHMGWDGHQAVYVAHNDTEHRHIHIILNKVSHDNGLTLNDWRDQPRSQVFALQYEKENGKLWCVERELRAAEREHRAPELDNAMQQPGSDRTPANDHIPHNVIELQRPYEKLFQAHEKAALDASFDAERGLLKAEQRAEREAWFKDGKKLLRETRHTVYDAVRAEQKQAWRDYYQAERQARQEAEALSGDALLRAHAFGREGRWSEAEKALADVQAVRTDAEYTLGDVFRDLKRQQRDEVRARQKEACDKLLAERKEQYQELLARQREERAAMRAAHAQGQSGEFVLEARVRAPGEAKANDNNIINNEAAVAPAPEQPAPGQQTLQPAQHPAHADIAEAMRDHVVEKLTEERSTVAHEGWPGIAREPSADPVNSVADLGAGAVGAAAGYLADQLGELFAPTPPEVREAREKAEAKREAEKPRPDEKPMTAYQRHIEAVIREAQRMEEEKRSRDYWTERDRGKDRDR